MSATPPGRACLTYLGPPRVVVFSPNLNRCPCPMAPLFCTTCDHETTRHFAQARLAAKPDLLPDQVRSLGVQCRTDWVGPMCGCTTTSKDGRKIASRVFGIA